MPGDTDLFYGIEYPSPAQPLYANINMSRGWCFHSFKPIRAVHLELNGCFQSSAIGGYPRLDVAARHPLIPQQALLSGFQSYFDAKQLINGLNRFVYTVELSDERRTFEALATLDLPDRYHVSDVFIDIVGSCNIGCAMCPQGNLEGRRGERGQGFMPVDLFERTMVLLQEHEAIGRYVNLYNWGDPLLHPDLGAILDVCRALGVEAIISTNLSYPLPRVLEVTRHPVKLLIVSLSGFSGETYSRNHVRGQFQRVRKNLEALAEDRGLVRDIVVKYLVFKYNHRELESARSFSHRAGFQFGAYAGAIPSAESYFRYMDDPGYRDAVHGFIDRDWIQATPSRFCPQGTVITLNHRAELERCCVSWTGGYQKSLFDTDLRNYLDGKLRSEFCDRCMSAGYSYYKHFAIVRPELLAESAF